MVARGYRGGDPDGAFGTDADGVRWFRTDDAGSLDAAGTLTVLGRLDDVIVTGGLKVSPGVVEAALLAMSEVTDAVVVGVPDSEWGERIVAFVVPAPGGQPPSLDAVRRLVGDRAGRHAAPHQVLALDRLPLSGPGKPDRTRLRLLAQGRPVPDRHPGQAG
jgi:O-succinylbenzoic acid--CoA ligase